MNIGAHPARLCVALLFCFGLLISEAIPPRRIAATNCAGDPLSYVRAAQAGVEELLTDDGSPEIILSGNNLMCVNRLKPSLYPATLQTIRIFFLPIPSNPAGAQIRLIAFESGQSQIQPPHNPSLLVDQTVTIPDLPPIGGFIDFPIQNGPTIFSGDFYIGFQAPNPAGAVTFAGDAGQPQERAYVSFDNGRDFRPLSDFPELPRLNLMIRAIVATNAVAVGGTIFVNSGAEQSGSINAAPPGTVVVHRTEYAIFVPAGASELKIDLSANQNLDLFVCFDKRVFPPGGGGVNPDHRSSNPGVTPEVISITPSSSPPLRSGLYYMAALNLGPGEANFTLKATVTGGTAPGATSIVSAASFSGPDLSGEAVAAAFGSGLATSMKSASEIPLPTDLIGTTIKVRDNAGTERLAPLFYVAPDQANFQIPPGTAIGAAFLTFTGGDGKVSTGVAQIAGVAPSIFAANADGRGPAVAFAVRAKADGSQSNESMLRLDPASNRLVLVPIGLGAESDQVFVILFGTGIRGVNSLSAVSATIGGVPVMLGFAGAQTQFVGVDQLNIGPLPRNLAGRGEVDVVITVEGKVANTVKIAVE